MALEQKPQIMASITFLAGSLTQSTFPITKAVTIIGRSKKNDIVVTDTVVSRVHARLIYGDDVWKIEKLSQTSKVTLNEEAVEQAELFDGAIVGLGEKVNFVFSLTRIDTSQPTTVIAVPAAQDQDRVVTDAHLDVQAASAEPASEYPTPERIERSPSTEIASFAAMGLSSIEVTDNTTGSRRVYPLLKEVVNIGRDPHNDIVINEANISRLHLRLVHEKEQWVLLHPHPDQPRTMNGLIYQGNVIKGDEPFRKVLAHRDIFRIGNEYGLLVTLRYLDGNNPREAAPRIQPIQLGSTAIVIGRSPDNDVVLNHPQVSAHHTRLVQEQETYRLTDLDSTNHTYINGVQADSQLLQVNDEIRIGPFRLVYTQGRLMPFDESNGIRIDALNLTKVGSNQVMLLNDISLSIPARSFVALVGGSGAGKTTLLDALSGLRPAHEGAVFYNGQDYYRNLAVFSSQLGYVPQDDIIHRELTVERALYYAAKLRLPRDFQEAQIALRIDEVLDDVEMKHRRSLLISQLSGGQRKRVSIALELLAKPSIFFLDEPTSGLDPGLDRKMMVLLRKLADKGHTIVLVTHATNNINVCDYVCFLAQGGNLAYFGPPEEAKAYFQQPDFAEIYSVLEPSEEKRTVPLEARETFENSQTYQRYVSERLSQMPKSGTQYLREQKQQVSASRRGALRRQFLLLTRRYIELLRNDFGNLAILLLQAPLFGLLLLVFIKGVGPDGFNRLNVLQCPATAAIVAVNGYPDVPTPNNPVVSQSCQRVENFLRDDAAGKAYAHARGGAINALQDFIEPGQDYQPTVLFLMAFAAIMFGCINAIREFVKEVPIYRRERTVNLGIVPYMFSKIAVLGLLCLLQSLVLVGCVAIFDPFRYSILLPPFLEVYITVALTSIAGLMLGLLVSAVSPNNDRAMSFLPLILLPQVIFSGTIFPLTNWFLQYPAMLFPIRWAMAALGSSVGLHSDKLNKDQLFGNTYTYHSTLFSIYSQQEAWHYLLLMWLALVVMILLLGVGIGYFLKRKDIQK